MAGRSYNPKARQQSQTSFDDSRSTSDKDSKDNSRSPSQTRQASNDDINNDISFDARHTNEKLDSTLVPARTYSNDRGRQHNGARPPPGPERRGTIDSIASLAGRPTPDEQASSESRWPKEWKAWVCLCGGFLLMFNSWGIVNAYGTYASYYKDNLLPGQDLLRMNLIGSTQSFVVLILSMPVGRFLDAGHIRKLLIVGTILVSLASFLIGVVNGDGEEGDGSYPLTWLTQGLISGLGMACFFVSSSQGKRPTNTRTEMTNTNHLLQSLQHGSRRQSLSRSESLPQVLPLPVSSTRSWSAT